jgi:protein-S-isoprenylcysteine O-methyltransferase Ste14
MSKLIQKSVALAILLMAAIIGTVSFMSFLFFLYAGPLKFGSMGMSEVSRLVFNTLLSVAFFLQHSVMIRKSFRRRLDGFIPPHYQGAAYTVASGLVLLGCMTLWQGSDIVLMEARGLLRVVMRTFYVLSIIGICWGMWALRSIDMFGLSPIFRNLRPKLIPPMRFTIRGPYRWVRHPLYLFMIVLFWSSPILTADRLLFDILWTIWVVIGTVLEERDLVDDFGAAYRAYQRNVPMLMPQRLRPAYSNGKSKNSA